MATRKRPWTTGELCKKFGVGRSRLSRLATAREVKPTGVCGQGREYLWPADAHLTLKPDSKYRPRKYR